MTNCNVAKTSVDAGADAPFENKKNVRTNALLKQTRQIDHYYRKAILTFRQMTKSSVPGRSIDSKILEQKPRTFQAGTKIEVIFNHE